MRRISFPQPGSQTARAVLSLLAILAVVPPQGSAQSQSKPARSSDSSVALHQALLDLTNPWTVMCVAAHPDDEDGTTLTVLRRKYGAHTVTVFSTYGEGGQNAVGPELYEELGVIRARETQAAAEIQGSEPYFLGLKDFGYSKSAEETFRVWGHEEALRRLVEKIRQLQPDVIISNHDTTRGHGHHQATGRLVLEAFDAAADPKRFPEQLSLLRPWQIQRIFVRSFAGPNAQLTEPFVAIDPNEVDPVRAVPYAQQALLALQQHATQGPWPKTIREWLRFQNNQTGRLNLIRYKLVKEAKAAQPFPTGASTFVEGLRLSQNISSSILPLTNLQQMSEHLNNPALVCKALIAWRYARLAPNSNDDLNRVRLLDARADRALAVAAGVAVKLSARENHLVPGDNATFLISVVNAGQQRIQLKELVLNGWGTSVPVETADQLLPDTETRVTVERKTPLNAKITVPRKDHLNDGLLSGQRFSMLANLELEGAKFSITTETWLEVTPAVEILDLAPSPYVLTPATVGKNLSIPVTLRNNRAIPFFGKLKISSSNLPLTQGDQTFAVNPYSLKNMELSVRLVTGARRAAHSGRAFISIEETNTRSVLTRLEVPVIYSDARVVPNRRIGYLASFDDTLERSLAALGVRASALSVSDIEQSHLANFDTIIIDNRGYEAHPQLVAVNPRLLQFVEEGGTLVVFYHKDNEWNPDVNKGRSQIAPYPIVLGEERVTDENAPVRFLAANHPLLTNPNHIGAGDFESWIQERGLYYPKSWDSHYGSLLSSNDPGEAPLDGGLLVARYGRGSYVYTSMVWYRQLRAGVPGAYRMLANMISYGAKGVRH